MTELSPGARAVEALQIQDVFLISSNCWVVRDLNPQMPMYEFPYGFKSHVEPEAVVQERADENRENAFFILRYFVAVEVRILKPGTSAEKQENFTDENTLAELKIKVATDYRGPADLVRDVAVIGAFARNAQFHAWPYLREAVHSACERLRIPRITLPMAKPSQPTTTPSVPMTRSSEAPAAGER